MDYGELRSAILYRTPDRWRWAVYSSEAVIDGWLPDLSPAVSVDVAQEAMREVLREMFASDRRGLVWEAHDAPGTWTAEPTSDEPEDGQ